MRRLPERFRGRPLAERGPINTYQQAVWWLFNAYELYANPLSDDEPLPAAFLLVCDLFWTTENQLRRDIERASSDLNRLCGRDGVPLPRRRGPFLRAG